MIAAWSPAATPRRVWPSMRRAFFAAIEMSAISAGGEARADRRAVHRRDDDLRAVDHVVDEVARLAPDARARLEVARHLLDHRHVAAGGEALARAAQDGDARLRVAVDVEPDARHLGVRARRGDGELALLAHHDLEDARLEPANFQVFVCGIVHRRILQFAHVTDGLLRRHRRAPTSASSRTRCARRCSPRATVDALTGAQVFFKCENLQRMGAFKFRGAYNALSQLTGREAARRGRVLLGQPRAGGGARRARLLGIRTVIVMPRRRAAGEARGDARLRRRGRALRQGRRPRSARRQARRASAASTLIPPFDHPHIVAGQGTAAKELIEDAGPLDVLLVPCGGGGLLSGCAIAARSISRRSAG